MSVMQTGLCPQREAYSNQTACLSVLSVWVFISYPEYISYIIWGRNAKIRVLQLIQTENHTNYYESFF